MLEINGINVQNMPHNNVVSILKDCAAKSSAIFVVQRHPVVYGHPYNVRMLGPHPSFVQNLAPPPMVSPAHRGSEYGHKTGVSVLRI